MKITVTISRKSTPVLTLSVPLDKADEIIQMALSYGLEYHIWE